MISMLVTISAIRNYMSKARKAQQQFDEASADMQKAAEDLCSRWQGDAAAAFAQEQGVFNNWCGQMNRLGLDYISVLDKALSTYEKMEGTVKSVIGGR